MELHGGTIAVRSEGEGKGTIFSVRLPLNGLKVAQREEALQTGRVVAVGDTSTGAIADAVDSTTRRVAPSETRRSAQQSQSFVEKKINSFKLVDIFRFILVRDRDTATGANDFERIPVASPACGAGDGDDSRCYTVEGVSDADALGGSEEGGPTNRLRNVIPLLRKSSTSSSRLSKWVEDRAYSFNDKTIHEGNNPNEKSAFQLNNNKSNKSARKRASGSLGRMKSLDVQPWDEAETEVMRFEHVLVVDDANSNRRMLSRLLRRRCTIIDEAMDGAVAVEKVRQSLKSGDSGNSGDRYDLIFMDYVMPNMDGPTATREIRAMGYDGIIIGLTGNVLQHDKELFLSSGASYILFKPFDLNQFEIVVKSLMGGRVHRF